MARHGVYAHALVNGEEIECMVNDVSAFSIRLMLPEPKRLPSQINVTITPRETHRLADVRWQRGSHVGIQFA